MPLEKLDKLEKLEKIYTHAEHTNCCTYFCIKGDFDPDVISKRLGLAPEASHKIGNKRSNGTAYDFAAWQFGTCKEYDILVEHQMMKTIAPLLPKTAILREIKREFDVAFTLEIVPTVRFDEDVPCLAPSLKVMQFCCDTGTELDIDLYVSCPDDFEDEIILENG